MLLFGMWLGMQVNRARRQRLALDAVLQRGGFIEYAHEYPGGNRRNGPRDDKADPPGPNWLRESIGDEYFVTPVGLQFWEEPISDDDLVHIGKLRDLEYLSFVADQNGQITGQGLSELTQLKKLRHLDLLAHPVTDDGLEHLGELTQLESIDLRNTKTTDAGLRHLTRLTNLKNVALDNTQISDAGLNHLSKLPNLQSVTLRRTNVTDAGVARFQEALPKCQVHR
jgi:hypothetical protein